MTFHQSAGLCYYTFESFDRHGLVHGLFTRHGGVSPAPWHSLNLGGTTGDSRENVIENRKRIFDVMERQVDSIFDAWQVHGTKVICTDRPRPLDGLHEKADSIITGCRHITLFMRFADCVPVFLFDPVKSVVGIVHAGWRGTVDRAPAVAVERMSQQYGSRPGDILAGIGPSICVDHFEVGCEVVEAVGRTFGAEANSLLKIRGKSNYFDLWKANQLTLEEIGVKKIEQSCICTFCHNEDWYSHRAEKGKTGRYGALLAL